MNSKQTLMRSAYKAFTLIELLVVVAIIGLLIAILIPGLMLAQEASNELRCKTQMDQIFKGAFFFTEDDLDGRLPYFGWLAGRKSDAEWWVTEVAFGMEHMEPEIYKCPSDTKPHQRARIWKKGGGWHMQGVTPKKSGGNNSSKLVTMTVPVTYRGSCDHIDGVNMVGRRLTEYTQPDRSVMIVEGAKVQEGFDADRECFRLISDMQALDFPFAKTHVNYHTWERHTGTSNILFMDGHIERMTPRDATDVAYETGEILGLVN